MMDLLIAVVDDNARFLDRARRVLSDAGYRVVTGTTGDAAALVAREMPDLAIFDLRTTDTESGMSLLDALCACGGKVALPTIFSSADARRLHEREGDVRALGCEALVKPFDRNDLLERIARMLAASRSDRSAP